VISLHELALTLECARCGAQREQWCVTSSGARASYLHAIRTRVVQAANAHGYCDGQASAYRSMLFHLESAEAQLWWAVRDGVPVLSAAQLDKMRTYLQTCIDRWEDR
jgi:hypothetical protein